MILGMPPFTFFHVLLSVIGILSGVVVVLGLIAGKRFDGWTLVFLTTTLATSVTGFLFPFHKLLPSHVLGAMSLVLLAFAIYGRYSRRLAGGWRLTYVITAVISFYFNVFVLIVQLFEKVPALRALAPTQSESPFKIAQLSALLLFVLLGFLSARGFRREAIATA